MPPKGSGKKNKALAVKKPAAGKTVSSKKLAKAASKRQAAVAAPAVVPFEPVPEVRQWQTRCCKRPAGRG